MDPFIGEIRIWAFNWAPDGWSLCDGKLLPIQQYTALYALLGTRYGGNGTTDFALPDLRGRAPVHRATEATILGTKGGVETVTLDNASMPAHTHTFAVSSAPGIRSLNNGSCVLAATTNDFGAPSAVVPLAPASCGVNGSGAPHNNMQSSLVVNYAIALQGIFPMRP